MLRPVLGIGAICASLVLAACGDDDDDAPAADQTAAASAPSEAGAQTEAAESGAGKANESGSEAGDDEGAAKPGVEITTADSQFGSVLFDSEQRAIYYFDKETASTSECYGDCAVAWPPVLTEGEPRAGGEAEEKLLGTTERDDGSTQVTYDGHPLYYYVDDPQGQVLCHNVEEFGGLWLAVEPGGAPVS
jgi:predicted lipoprotein with Yx(FWY)xxD motif